MIRNIKDLYARELAASDGHIGRVSDFYFDDMSWAVRYLVAETGDWMKGQKILLSPHALGHLVEAGDILKVNLPLKQIEHAPPFESHLPVSRQYEERYYQHYGWPTYWNGGGVWGLGDVPIDMPRPVEDLTHHHGHQQREDVHLRSTRAMDGFHIQAADGPMGSVSDFVLDEERWIIREMIVETGTWFSGKKIAIAPSMIQRISYEESKVFVNLTQNDIRQTTENQRAVAVESSH